MADMYDIESQIMSAWNIVDDLKVINEAICEQDLSIDQISNALLGLEQLYALKFERLFKTYEKVLKIQFHDKNLGFKSTLSGNDNIMDCALNQKPVECRFKCPDYQVCDVCQTPAYRDSLDDHDDIPF
jgi:hypothetical protein